MFGGLDVNVDTIFEKVSAWEAKDGSLAGSTIHLSSTCSIGTGRTLDDAMLFEAINDQVILCRIVIQLVEEI